MRTTRDVVAQNVASIRNARGMSVREMSATMERLGRKILPSGITAIEQGNRGVNAEELVALAVALGVNPNRLLLPADSNAEEIELTPAVKAAAFQAWPWAQGEAVLLAGEVATGRGDRAYGEVLDDFRRHALPASERLRDDHTAVRAARDVLDGVQAVLDRRDHPERFVPEDSPLGASMAKAFGPSPGTPAALRANLRRLVAEVDALIGDDDGDR